MKYLTPLCLALFCASCVTSSDLRRIEDAQGAYRIEVDATIGDLQSDAITADEADARIAAADRDLRDELATTIDTVEERTTAIATAAKKIPTDPLSLLTYIGGLGAAVMGTGAVAGRKVNRDRDMARRLRGEKTGVAS